MMAAGWAAESPLAFYMGQDVTERKGVHEIQQQLSL